METNHSQCRNTLRFLFDNKTASSFSSVPTYNFVGEGVGSYEKEDMITYRVSGLRRECLCLLCLCVLAPIIGLLLWMARGAIGMFSPQPAPLPAVGAPTVPPMPAAPDFDCESGYTNWVVGWSADKKQFCCEHFSRGCPTTTTPCQYDCNAGYSSWVKGWATAKKEYCCSHAGKGCPGSEPPLPAVRPAPVARPLAPVPVRLVP